MESFPDLNNAQATMLLDDETRERISSFIHGINSNPYNSTSSLESFIAHSGLLLRLLPDPVLLRLLSFRATGTKDGALLIKGFPIEQRLIGPTPLDWSERKKSYFGPESCLLGAT